jgi:hypothetical protein
MTTTDPDWIQPGATVAEYRSHIMSAHVDFTTVEKLTATQVVCANGSRYRRDDSDDAHRQGLRAVGSGRDILLPSSHPDVLAAVAAAALRELRGQVDRMLRDFRGDATVALATLDEITAAVAATRTVVEGETP